MYKKYLRILFIGLGASTIVQGLPTRAIAQTGEGVCKTVDSVLVASVDAYTTICKKNKPNSEYTTETFALYRFSATTGRVDFLLHASFVATDRREAWITFKNISVYGEETIQFTLRDRRFKEWGSGARNAIAVNDRRSDIKLLMDAAEKYPTEDLTDKF